MITYKLTVNLDATLSVQNENGSFNYFKPSVGAEITTDEMVDLAQLSEKFDDLYETVIGPNFNSVVTEFLLTSKDSEDPNKDSTNGCENCDGTCTCKGEPSDDVKEVVANTAKEEWE